MESGLVLGSVVEWCWGQFNSVKKDASVFCLNTLKNPSPCDNSGDLATNAINTIAIGTAKAQFYSDNRIQSGNHKELMQCLLYKP